MIMTEYEITWHDVEHGLTTVTEHDPSRALRRADSLPARPGTMVTISIYRGPDRDPDGPREWDSWLVPGAPPVEGVLCECGRPAVDAITTWRVEPDSIEDPDATIPGLRYTDERGRLRPVCYPATYYHPQEPPKQAHDAILGYHAWRDDPEQGPGVRAWIESQGGLSEIYRRADEWLAQWRIDSQVMLTRDEVAAMVGVTADTWSAYVARRYAPPPDEHIGRTPRWRRSTIASYLAARPGQGSRTDLRTDPESAAQPEG
jgi:hypothetical protein